MNASLSANLRKIRGGVSQNEFATALGVSQAAWSSYEKGKTEPGLDLVVRICETYGCTAEWLLGFGRDEDRRPAPKASEFTSWTVDASVTFGQRLRALRRERLGISAGEVGSRLSRPRGAHAVRLWETGKTSPDAATVDELANMFGVTAGWLLDGPETEPLEQTNDSVVAEPDGAMPALLNPTSLADDEWELLDSYRVLGRKGKAALGNLVAAMVVEADD